MPQLKTALASQIEREIQEYLTGTVQFSDGVSYSQPKLVRRIGLFEAKTYPTGKWDRQKNYKFWFDIISARIAAGVKNIDFDTKNIEAYSDRKVDLLPNMVTNLCLGDYLKSTGQAEEINSAVEEGESWGNVVWKKIKGGYERMDLRNFYVINQTAKSLDESPVIERHQYSQSDLREKSGKWEYIDEVLTNCKSNYYSSDVEALGKETTVPYYDIYERNGEVKLSDLKEANGQTPAEGDRNKYVLAKVISAGKKGSAGGVEISYVLFADTLSKLPYKEYHRGVYRNRWMREGIIELLFDLQVRYNEVGNQLAQGLAWASKVIFTGDDKQIIQNIMTDLKNGDYLKSKDLRQVEVRMQGFDQLANECNRILALADQICNSQEVVQGVTPASGTPLGTTQLLNQNANKLYDFIREKLAIPFSEMFEEWVIPEMVKKLKAQDVIRLVGDSDVVERLLETLVDDWYIRNLIEIGPHDQQFADSLKAQKIEELKSRPQILMSEVEAMFEDYYPHVKVDITGEGLRRNEQANVLATFIPMEADPVRRSALIEMAMLKSGIDVGALPKSEPQQPMNPQQPQPNQQATPQSLPVQNRKVGVPQPA